MKQSNAVTMLRQAEVLLKDRESLIYSAGKLAKKLTIDTAVQLYKALGACEAMFKDARKPLSAKLQKWTVDNAIPESSTEVETIKGVDIARSFVRYKATSKKWKFNLTEYEKLNSESFKKNSPTAFRDAMRTHSTKAIAFRVDPL